MSFLILWTVLFLFLFSCQKFKIQVLLCLQILNWVDDFIPSACESSAGKQEVSCNKLVHSNTWQQPSFIHDLFIIHRHSVGLIDGLLSSKKREKKKKGQEETSEKQQFHRLRSCTSVGICASPTCSSPACKICHDWWFSYWWKLTKTLKSVHNTLSSSFFKKISFFPLTFSNSDANNPTKKAQNTATSLNNIYVFLFF